MTTIDQNKIAPFEGAVVMCNRFVTEVIDDLKSCEAIYDGRVDAVENRSRDGFIPYTEGGFEGVGYAELSYDYGSGTAPQMIQPYIDSALKDAQEEWDRENPEHTVEWIYDDEADENERKQLKLDFVKGYCPTKREEWREKWYEFESTWLSEGGTYFYKVRALFYDVGNHRNQSGKPEVYFFVGINTDFEYGRDSIPWMSCYGAKTQQTEWLWERNVPVDEITSELIDEMIAEATKALRDA